MPKKKIEGEPQFTAAVLKLKIGASANCPTKRMLDDFHQVAQECNRARNAMVREMIRWHEDNQEWSRSEEGRKSKFPLPKKINDQSGSMLLYQAARQASPKVASVIASLCTQDVFANMGTKLSVQQWFEFKKKYSYQWQAIIDFAFNPRSYKALSIPIHNVNVGLYYHGFGLNMTAKHLGEVRTKIGNGSAISVPLFSRDSGRFNTSALFRIRTRSLPRGHKKILRRIASGEWKVSESEICLDKDGQWFFHLTYKQPVKCLGLNRDRVAMVEVQYGKEGYPFKVFVAGNEKMKPWNVGQTNPLIENQKRLELKRLTLQKRNGIRGSGARGHGRERLFQDIKPATRRIQDMGGTFIKLTVAEILRFCERFDCGTVCFRCPSDGFKKKTVIANTFPQFNWSAFDARLKAKMLGVGIPVVEKLEEITQPKKKKGRCEADNVG